MFAEEGYEDFDYVRGFFSLFKTRTPSATSHAASDGFSFGLEKPHAFCLHSLVSALHSPLSCLRSLLSCLSSLPSDRFSSLLSSPLLYSPLSSAIPSFSRPSLVSRGFLRTRGRRGPVSFTSGHCRLKGRGPMAGRRAAMGLGVRWQVEGGLPNTSYKFRCEIRTALRPHRGSTHCPC